MAEIPQTFRQQPSAAVASYDWTDIASGTGVVHFYGAEVGIDSAGTNPPTPTAILTENIIPTSSNEEVGRYTEANSPGSAADYTKILDIDFDLAPFNFPKNIKGTAYADILIGCIDTGTVNTTTGFYAYIKIRKYSDTTETEIAKAKTTAGSAAAQIQDWDRLSCKIDIDDVAHFKKGDILRLTVEIWAKSATNGRDVRFYHDPANLGAALTSEADSETYTKILNFYIPFRIP